MKQFLKDFHRAMLGAALAAALASPALAQNYSGTGPQPIGRGGTGKATLAQNSLLFGNGTSPIGFLSPAGMATFMDIE